jgi:hypothetical protein
MEKEGHIRDGQEPCVRPSGFCERRLVRISSGLVNFRGGFPVFKRFVGGSGMNLGKLKNVVWPDLATRHIAVTCFKTRDEFSATGSLDPQRSYRQCLEKKSDFKGGIRSTRCRNGECQDGDQQRKGESESTPNILPNSTLSPRCLVSCIVYVSSPARLFFADTPNFPVHFPLGTGLSKASPIHYSVISVIATNLKSRGHHYP